MVALTTVTKLPVVDGTLFPALSSTLGDKRYVIFDSKWDHYAEEEVVASILTATTRRGKWEAIPWSDIVHLIREVDANLGFDFDTAFQHVADTGDIQLVMLNGETYLVPTPVLAETIRHSTILIDAPAQ